MCGASPGEAECRPLLLCPREEAGGWVGGLHPPRLWPGCAPVTAALAHPGSSAFPALLAAIPQMPALAAVAQPGSTVQLLLATSSPCLPPLSCCWVRLMPKPCLLLPKLPCCAFSEPAPELPVLG